MGFADVWNRTLVYFGIAEEDEDWDEDGYATEEELAIREVNAGLYLFEGGELLAALAELDTDNAQGELDLPGGLPDLRPRSSLSQGPRGYAEGFTDQCAQAQQFGEGRRIR